jgi:hypothetical protein
MQIIFGKENAEELRTRYTVLDLEEIPVDGHGILSAYCVIPSEKIGLDELPQLESWVKLHHDFINGYKTQQYDYCLQCIEHLMGRFGGEVDTFYEEIKRRIDSETVAQITD